MHKGNISPLESSVAVRGNETGEFGELDKRLRVGANKMDKATKALKRSSIRLKSMRDSHVNLRMAISQLQDVRSSAKSFMQMQATASEDLVKWAVKNENQALQDTFLQIFELNTLWTEVQREFTAHMKEFIHGFELVLEGELHVDAGRSQLLATEQREHKLEKELAKAGRRHLPAPEVAQLHNQLAEERQAKRLAQQEVNARVQENEAVKMTRVKQGLLQLSESYLELAHKCSIVFNAQREIAMQIPDVGNSNIHEIQYSGAAEAQQAVQRARELLRHTGGARSCVAQPCAPREEPPPPYSAPGTEAHMPTHSPELTSMHDRYSCPPSTLLQSVDVRWQSPYEQDMADAMSRMKT